MNAFDEFSSSRSCCNEDLGQDNEARFLEKYFYDLITDNCDHFLTNTLYRTLIEQIKDKKQLETILSLYLQEQIEMQKRQKIHSKYFFTKKQISMKNLIYQFRQLLSSEENINNSDSTLSRSIEFNKSSSVSKSDFIELYENLLDNQELQQGELIYIDTKFRITNSELKEELSKIRQHILKQLIYDENFYQTFSEYYNHNRITVLLFVNADTNFEYQKYFDLKELYVGKRKFKIKMKVCYVSGNRVFQNFCSANNIYHYSISQQNMAFYELKRYGQLKININKTISEICNMKKKNNYSIFKDYRFYLAAIGVAVGCGLFYFRGNKTRVK